MTVFPILKLPLLATEEVLKQLSFDDIYPLSKCSKRCSNMIRLANTKKYTLYIRPSVSSLFLRVDHYHIMIPKDKQKRNSEDPTLIDTIIEKLRAGLSYLLTTFKFLKKKFSLFWKMDSRTESLSIRDDYEKSWEHIEKVKTELSHLLTTFKFHQKSFVCSGIWTPEQNQLLLEMIIREQGNTFEDFSLSGNYGDMSNQWILENIKVNNILATPATFPQKGFIFKTCPKVFRSRGSSWITFDTLISLGACKAIEVYETVLLAVKDIDSFLEMWKKDTFPNLEYLHLGNMKWEDNETILGFTREQLSVDRVPTRRKKIGYVSYSCIGGVDIQSDGGVNGTLYFNADLVSVSFFAWKE